MWDYQGKSVKTLIYNEPCTILEACLDSSHQKGYIKFTYERDGRVHVAEHRGPIHGEGKRLKALGL